MQPPAASTVSPEIVSKAGAGALLLAVALVELALEFWAAGWWQRSCGLLVVAVGAALLTHGAAAIVRELGTPQLQRRARPKREPVRAAFLLTGQSRLAE